MGTGQFDFGHVACGAAILRYLAHSRPPLAAAVAGLALGVVIDGFAVHLVVRVMAGKATDARVIRLVAFAWRQLPEKGKEGRGAPIVIPRVGLSPSTFARVRKPGAHAPH